MKKRLLCIIMVSFMTLQAVACGSADVASAEGLQVEKVSEAEESNDKAVEAEVVQQDENASEAETVAAVETQTENTTHNQVLDFSGQYYAGKGNLSITKQEDDNFLIEVWWQTNAAQHGEWVMHGKFDGVDTITYSDCVKHEYTLNDNGEIDVDETVYTDGTGNIKIVDDSTIMWNDDMEHIADEVEMTR